MTYIDPRAENTPKEDTAVLLDFDSLNDALNARVMIREVNGISTGNMKHKHRIAPGVNTVLVLGNSHVGLYEAPRVLRFTAEKGKTYVMRCEINTENSIFKPGTWIDRPHTFYAWIVDKETNIPVNEHAVKNLLQTLKTD